MVTVFLSHQYFPIVSNYSIAQNDFLWDVFSNRQWFLCGKNVPMMDLPQIAWWWDLWADLKISNVHVQSLHICKGQTVQNENLYFSKYKHWGLYKWTYYGKSLFSADLYIVWHLAISRIFFKLHYASQDFEIFFEYFSTLFKDLLCREL